MKLQNTIRFRSVLYGSSTEKLPLEYFCSPEADEKKFKLLLMAGVHGEEADGMFVLSRALRQCENLNSCAVIVCANPEGVLRATRANSRGVDLNRNFPTRNWSPEPVMVRPFAEGPRDNQLSPGKTASSEPETRHLIELVEQIDADTIISIHSPLDCIDAAPDNALANTLSKLTGLRRVSDIGYETPGSFGTWCAERGRKIITVELPPAGGEELVKRFSPVFTQLMEKGTID